jgi:hypothetical protein
MRAYPLGAPSRPNRTAPFTNAGHFVVCKNIDTPRQRRRGIAATSDRVITAEDRFNIAVAKQ